MILGVGLMSIPVFAESTGYEQPFEAGTMGSDRYRIPAIITLNDGSVLAAADMRYGHGTDSPHNIDTLVAHSADGYTNWAYQVVNYFDDCADGETDTSSASFIDSALVQSEETGRIFLVTDAFPSGGGYPTAKTGTGYVEVGGKKYLALTDGDDIDSFDNFRYYIGEFADGFAPVVSLDTGDATAYTVDTEYALYKDGEPIYMEQLFGNGKLVQQTVFSINADFTVYCTPYLWMRYSDDNGKTWSAPMILSEQFKAENESFLGICPGRGFVTQVDGHERILFMVYDNARGNENVSTIYSDDNGMTWQRGAATQCIRAIGKTSESQIVSLPDGTLRMFARNAYSFIAYADSTDGGVTWSTFRADTKLSANANCMVSFINLDKKIGGKSVILGSFVSDIENRADGVVRVGLVGKNNVIDWISTYHVTDDFFAYSCLTQLADGNIGYLYEDEAAHISYKILTLADDGTLSEIGGNNLDYTKKPSAAIQLRLFFRALLVKLQLLFKVL